MIFLHYLDKRLAILKCSVMLMAWQYLDQKRKIFDSGKSSNDIFINLKIPSDTFQFSIETEKILSILFLYGVAMQNQMISSI